MAEITQEQWEKACKRAGINARSGPMHVAHRRSDMPPIGDPATVLAMLEWLVRKNFLLDYRVNTAFGAIFIFYKQFPAEFNAAGEIDERFYAGTMVEAIVRAVLALPEVTNG